MSRNSKMYVSLTLAVSWIATVLFYYMGKLNSMVTLIMLFPAICAVIIRIKTKSKTKDMIVNPNFKGIVSYLIAIIFAIVFPAVIIILCAITGAIIYKVPLNNDFFKLLFNIQLYKYILPKSFISMNIIFSFGEEYGWRGYLLPELIKRKSIIKSIVILGIVWALYHFPVLIFMNIDKIGIMEALKIALIQAGAAFVFSFGFAKCYLISNGLYPVVIMHTFWNMLNPYMLGSIYEGSPGLVLSEAPVEIINGEGVLGIVFGGIFAVYLIIMAIIKKKWSKKFGLMY